MGLSPAYVKKSGSMWQPCSYFLVVQPHHGTRQVATAQDGWPGSTPGCTFFSVLDLQQLYHQIPMPATNIKMTAIITPFGLFQYTRMSFGLQNTGQTFQGMMSGVISGLVGIFCYLDNILVASADEQMYHCCFQLLLECLRQFGLVLKV